MPVEQQSRGLESEIANNDGKSLRDGSDQLTSELSPFGCPLIFDRMRSGGCVPSNASTHNTCYQPALVCSSNLE